MTAADRLAAALHASIEAYPRACAHPAGGSGVNECEWMANAVLTWQTDLWSDLETGAAWRRFKAALPEGWFGSVGMTAPDRIERERGPYHAWATSEDAWGSGADDHEDEWVEGYGSTIAAAADAARESLR